MDQYGHTSPPSATRSGRPPPPAARPRGAAGAPEAAGAAGGVAAWPHRLIPTNLRSYTKRAKCIHIYIHIKFV